MQLDAVGRVCRSCANRCRRPPRTPPDRPPGAPRRLRAAARGDRPGARKSCARPAPRRRLTGIELTIPPSMKCSPLIGTGRKDARDGTRGQQASASGPRSNQCSAARSIDAATHWKGSSSSSTRSTGSSATSRSRISDRDSRSVPLRASVVEPAKRAPRGASAPVRLLPQLAQAIDAGQGGIGGEEGAVDRADGGPKDDVRPDAALGQRAQHPDLVRSEEPPPPRTNASSRADDRVATSRTAPSGARPVRAPGTRPVVTGIVHCGSTRRSAVSAGLSPVSISWRRCGGCAGSSQAASASGARITGMRSCSGAIALLAAVVRIVQVRSFCSSSPYQDRPQTGDHRPGRTAPRRAAALGARSLLGQAAQYRAQDDQRAG